MKHCVLLQHILVPETWIHNLYVPLEDFDKLVSKEELDLWRNNEDIDDIIERLCNADNVVHTKMVDDDISPQWMPEDVVVCKYYLNVQSSN